MGVIMVVCAAFALTVWEAKTEIMYLRAKRMPESLAIFSVEATGQAYNQTNEFVYLGGNVNYNTDLSIEVDQRIRNAWCSFRKYTLELYGRPSAPLTGQVYNPTNEFVYLGGTSNHNTDLSIEVDRRIRNAWCSFRKYTLELYVRPSAPLELKIRMLRAEVLERMLYSCVAWSPRACHYDTLRRAHHRFLTRCIGWRKNNRADHPISNLDTLVS